MEWAVFLFFCAYIVFVIGYLAWGILDIVRNAPKFHYAWRLTDETSRFSFNLGWMLFLVIPMVRNLFGRDHYLAQVLLEILPAVAGGLFVAGLLALMTQLREVERMNREGDVEEG